MPLGPSIDESLFRAAELRERLCDGRVEVVARNVGEDLDFGDTVQALYHILEAAQNEGSDEALQGITTAYELVSNLPWDDEFCEGEELLARLAFLAWNHCRRFRNFPERKRWERECVNHALAQDQVCNFLATPFVKRSEELNRRFLSDPAVLLTACETLAAQPNNSPSYVTEEAGQLYEWICEPGRDLGLDDESVAHFAGTLALAATASEGHLGRAKEWNSWFQRARAHFEKTTASSPSLAALDLARLARLHVVRDYEAVADQVQELIDRFASLSMPEKMLKARFVQGLSFKELGQYARALRCLDQVRSEASEHGDSLVVCMCLINAAQIHGLLGQFEIAITQTRAAAPFAIRSGCQWALGEVEATVGELRRDRGDYSSAVVAYRSALSRFVELKMESFASYFRLLLAETLLLAGRELEALEEIIAALPVIERENLSREATVATGLLREAVRRQRANPEALRELRGHVQRMKEGSQL